jgi:hypothetical protein
MRGTSNFDLFIGAQQRIFTFQPLRKLVSILVVVTLVEELYALREEETDLSFLDFGGTKRHPRGTEPKQAVAMKKPLRVTPRRGLGSLERETGFEPATLSLGM